MWLEGGEVSIPLDGMNEPRFAARRRARHGATRQQEIRQGHILPRSGKPAKILRAGRWHGEDAFRFALSRDEFVDLSRRSRIAGPRQAEARRKPESEDFAGRLYQLSSPANIFGESHGATSLARRGRPAPAAGSKTIAQLRRNSSPATRRRRSRLRAEIEALKAKARRFHSSIRSTSAIAALKPCKARWPSGHVCLMDVSGSMSAHMKDLAKRFYMFAVCVSDADAIARRDRLIRHTDRRKRLTRAFFRGPHRAGTMVSSALESARDFRLAVSPLRLEFTPPKPDGDNSLADRGRRQPAADGDDPAGQPVICLSRSRPRQVAAPSRCRIHRFDALSALSCGGGAAVDAQGQRPQRNLSGCFTTLQAPPQAGESRA